MTADSGWATQQLAEFLAALSATADDDAALREALERLAESFEADAGAFFRQGHLLACLGWPPGQAPEDALRASCASGDPLHVEGVGPCEVVVIPVDRATDTSLLLARSGLAFTASEVGLLRGMGRVLALALRLIGALTIERRQAEENRALVDSLRARQALMERLSRIQRKISTRVPLKEVLGAIAAGAAELLGDDVAALRLVDDAYTGVTVLAASSVGDAGHVRSGDRLPLGTGVGGRAIRENRACAAEPRDVSPDGIGAFVGDRLRSGMAAPIVLDGVAAGALVVGSARGGRVYEPAEQEILLAFAEHASLALNDARTVKAMNFALEDATRRALHDDLTGLPNRACFYDRADQALRIAARAGTETAVLLFDLDRFKEINDTLGHKWGDQVLRAIGPRFRTVLRDTDTLARLGGDEFCVLLPNVNGVSSAVEVAERLVGLLDEPFEIDGMTLAVEASCGLATAPAHGDDVDALLQRADVAMYVAKGSHSSVVTYDPDLNINTPARLSLLNDLRRAIANDELVLYYQPKASLASGRIVGVEALVRWEHPTLGLLSPDLFIPLAEHTGLIKPLTTWVLDTALRQLKRWRDGRLREVTEDLSVAVNLSTRCLLDDTLPGEVTAALARWGVPANRLELELTESSIMADPNRAHRLLTELASSGVRLAIDDFGTGYSSLAYLKNLPVNQLKIDRSFVMHMHENPSDAIIVRSVIDLGHNLGLETVAEGIEDLAAWQQLTNLGCDGAQGYFLARPMPADAAGAWLAERARVARRAERHLAVG